MAKKATRTALDDKRKGDVAAIVSVGCGLRTAAEYVGSTVRAIRAAARCDAKFSASLLQAEHAAEIALMRNIQQASTKAQFWRAAAWVLERCYPNRYAARGPDVVTTVQLRDLMGGIADLILDVMPLAKDRQAILRRLDHLARDLIPRYAAQPPLDEDENTAAVEVNEEAEADAEPDSDGEGREHGGTRRNADTHG